MSRGSLISLLVAVLILFFVYSYLKDRLVGDSAEGDLAAIDHAAAAGCLANQHALRAAIASHRMAHAGHPPATLDELVPRFLASVPHCPNGALYEYDVQSGEVTCPEGHGG